MQVRLDARIQEDEEESEDEQKDTKVGTPTIRVLAPILYQPEKSKPIDNRKFQRVAAAHSIGQSLAISAFPPIRATPFLTIFFRLPSAVCPSLSRLGTLSANFLRPASTQHPSRCRLAPLQVTT